MPIKNSGINPKHTFDEDHWVVHLVNMADALPSLFFGGHAALIVEGLQGDNIVLRFYDIRAVNLPSRWLPCGGHSQGASEARASEAADASTSADMLGDIKFGYVVNVKIAEKKHYHADRAGTKAFYKDKQYRRSSVRSFPINHQQSTQLAENVLNDQRSTVRGIVNTFIRAKADKTAEQLQQYFLHQDLLEQYSVPQAATHPHAGVAVLRYPFQPGQTEQGIKPIIKFLRYCEGLAAAVELTPEQCTDFLTMMNSHDRIIDNFNGAEVKGLLPFLVTNMRKMRQDGFLSTHNASIECPLMHFRLTGPGLFYDNRSLEERTDARSPLNCMRWCKDHLELVNLEPGIVSDKPKALNLCTLQ